MAYKMGVHEPGGVEARRDVERHARGHDDGAARLHRRHKLRRVVLAAAQRRERAARAALELAVHRRAERGVQAQS